MHVRPSVCPSSVMISSSTESPKSDGVKQDWGGYELAIFDLYATLSPKQCKIGPRLLLTTRPNRKSHTRFGLVPKSTTLVDPELTLNGYYTLTLHYTRVFRSPPLKLE